MASTRVPTPENKGDFQKQLSPDDLLPYELVNLPNGLILAKGDTDTRLLLLGPSLEVLDTMTVSKFKLKNYIIFADSQIVIGDTSNNFLDVHLFDTSNRKIELRHSLRHRDTVNVTFTLPGSSLSYTVISPVEINSFVRMGEDQVRIETQQMGAIMRRANLHDMIVRPHTEIVKKVGSTLRFMDHQVLSNNTSALFDPGNRASLHPVTETVKEERCLVM